MDSLNTINIVLGIIVSQVVIYLWIANRFKKKRKKLESDYAKVIEENSQLKRENAQLKEKLGRYNGPKAWTLGEDS